MYKVVGSYSGSSGFLFSASRINSSLIKSGRASLISSREVNPPPNTWSSGSTNEGSSYIITPLVFDISLILVYFLSVPLAVLAKPILLALFVPLLLTYSGVLSKAELAFLF